jgi:DNA-binding NtrC family response regulator
MGKTRGLIVDDDRDLAKFLKIVLGLAGFECETAHTSRAVLNFLASNEPDLIFLDLKLGPDVQGSDLLYHIRSNPRYGCAQNMLDGASQALEAARHTQGMRCFVLEPMQRPLAA